MIESAAARCHYSTTSLQGQQNKTTAETLASRIFSSTDLIIVVFLSFFLATTRLLLFFLVSSFWVTDLEIRLDANVEMSTESRYY